MYQGVTLSPEVLAQIVASFGGRPEDGPHEFWRFPLRRCEAVACSERGDQRDKDMNIEILNLSLQGLGFKTSTPLAKGMILNVALSIPGLPPQTWACRVAHVYSYDGREYCAGAQFEHPSSPEGDSPCDQRRKPDHADGSE
jgi:hypothetical protein